jgi:hypothetical protein
MMTVDLGISWEWALRSLQILACQEGTLEQRCRRAVEDGLIPAVPFLPDNYLGELRHIEQDLSEGRPLSTLEARNMAQGILYIISGISFRYAQEEAVKKMQQGDGPQPLPRPPSTN